MCVKPISNNIGIMMNDIRVFPTLVLDRIRLDELN